VPDSEYYLQQGDLRLIDVTDPRKPVQVSDWSAFRDGGFRAEEGYPWGHSVSVNAAGTMAAFSTWDGGAALLDITDPAHPTLRSRITYPAGSAGNTHSAVFLPDDSRLLIADETLTPVEPPHPWGFLRIWDIREPTAPTEIAQFATRRSREKPTGSGVYSIHNPVVRGNLAYLSWFSDGVRVLDISRPEAPREIASYVPASAYVWGIHEANGTVVASDINSGLYVLKLR